ncbi:sigma 54 modulation/S30EA ribosomal C-terminal domain-containing protein [Streptomyces sp. NRRL B-24484]|uniref:sigma 54 modulation/S30EA ribosomal C-terminal domain-containing protein n=1 Tax=Streptomyces sp. NRRL B-24484 TaxID=1463833 RepID=UPI0004C09689|nr:sigma 54 modulation/S30EA ribosomal C-terminal domain-containing protein [Streptomyces sp. NRRL B-24484]
MNRLQTRPAAGVRVETRGEVTRAAPDYARAKLTAVLDRLDEPVLAVRVRLTQEPNHAMARPSLAQAVVDLNGRPVRAHVAAATMQEAIDLLQDRLNARIARVRRHRDHHRHHGTAPDTGGDRTGRGHRPQRRERDGEDRRIVRHKSYGLARQTAWEAVLELEAMDYDFHLFTDTGTGFDSLVHRDTADGGYRLATTHPQAVPVPGLPASTVGAPELTAADAATRLDLGGLPFVFFTDAASGRGHVLYHRYDGHYGLITPVL